MVKMFLFEMNFETYVSIIGLFMHSSNDFLVAWTLLFAHYIFNHILKAYPSKFLNLIMTVVKVYSCPICHDQNYSLYNHGAHETKELSAQRPETFY